MGVDPLSLWHRTAREPPNVHAPEVSALQEGLGRVHRYLAYHRRREPLPPFELDTLRQEDLRVLGFGPEPVMARLSSGDREILRALVESLYARDSAPDEPWIERQALFSLGYVRDRDESGWWARLLHRSGAGDRFASERRGWALAALSWRAGVEPDGASEQALRDAMGHPRADVRATAAVYLLAAHRLSHRAAPMSSVSALFRLCNDDPALEPRAVARVLLEVDRVEVPWDPEDSAFVLGFGRIDEPRRPLGEATLRAMHTLSHVDSVVRALRGERDSSAFSVALSGSVRGSRFDLATSEGLGRRPGDVALAAIGLRVGDQLRHASDRGETSLTVRAVETRALSSNVSWAGLALPVPLIETQVNGTRFHRAKEALEYLQKGSLVRLVRERDNSHDDRAIEVITERGDKLGYVPRGRNRVLAALMDAGERAHGEVLTAGLEKETPLVWIRISVEPPRPSEQYRTRRAG
ncbi:MAG: HIRAN domain-containing protein [Myxococcales bacterium]|nr:HIRAN domain-containing protein [Myxococcales bacterium]